MAVSRDGRHVAAGYDDHAVRIWDTASGGPPRVLKGHDDPIRAVAFSPGGATLAAGATDGTVWMWNLADPARPALIATLTGPQGHVFSVAFSPSGRTLAAASNDGTVHLWDTSPAAAKADVCADAGQGLTRQEWATYIPGVTYRAPC